MQGLDRTVHINSSGAIDRAIFLLPMGHTCMLWSETIANVTIFLDKIGEY